MNKRIMIPPPTLRWQTAAEALIVMTRLELLSIRQTPAWQPQPIGSYAQRTYPDFQLQL